MNSISILDIVLIAGVSQGIFLALSLQFLKNQNKEANKVLVWVLLISVIMLLGRLLAFRVTADWIKYAGLTGDTTLFLVGPLIYMYVRRLAFMEKPPFRLGWIHFALAVLHLLYGGWYMSLSDTTLQSYFDSGFVYYLYFIVEAVGVLSLGYYVFLSFRLLRHYRKRQHQELSNPLVLYRFLKVFLWTLTACFVFWIASFLNMYFFRLDSTFLRYSSLWLSIPVFIYIVAYYSLRQPEIFRILYKKPTADRARLKPDEIEKIQKRLHYFMLKETVYLDSDLTLSGLSEKLHTTSNNLSWYLNNIHKASFSEYINELRISAFLQKIENEEHQKKTLLALAMEVGFNSKSNFNKVFKNQIGASPSAYIKAKKVA
ncbi:MAG: AraC family transcriptional regulator [Bacteroidetes bacterium]|nr:AraC family transcriptional regulator [Bacteroidota bacterium]